MVPGGRSPAGAAVAPRAHAPSALLRSLFAQKCARKGPELGNVVRTQGRNQAVVCGAVLRNSVPCVRNRELRPKGAPSTIRCIETCPGCRPGRTRCRVRRYLAPSGASRLVIGRLVVRIQPQSGGTQRHQVYLRPCSRGAGRGPLPKCQGYGPTDTVVAPRADAPSVLIRPPSVVRCAHKGPELGNVVRTQGRNQAVVCGVVLRNSVPCVRNRELRAKGAPSTIGCIEAGP